MIYYHIYDKFDKFKYIDSGIHRFVVDHFYKPINAD